MEDCCAVCAEPLEWVALGSCNHRDVCSTCVARLRLVMKDKRCCICKQESDCVFVTKFLGDYTKPAGDFSQLAERAIRSGRSGGDLWYDPDIEAYFDDKDHCKTIQDMNRLSCSVCEKAEGGPVPAPLSATRGILPKDFTFRGIDALKRHYYGAHKLLMCDLCLEGRKIFISEQKLYTRAQLEKHGATGNSEVDGTEEERGGFKGHPACQFCKRRFYGDNELYQHMSQEHYTCFLCQRARPGSYEYFNNYNDLETHFRGEHFLCEDRACLEKKFVVFAADQELKRHNVQQHGGNMSRAERNRALQIPASQLFNFSRRPSHDSEPSSQRRGGPRGRQPGGPSVLVAPHPEALEASVRASMETAALEAALRESAALADSTDAQRLRANRLEAERSTRVPGADAGQAATPPPEAFPALSAQEPGLSGTGSSAAAYASSVQRGGPSLEEEYFPPLPGGSKSAKKRAKAKGQASSASMAALLGGGQSLSLGSGAGQQRVQLGFSPCDGVSRNNRMAAGPRPSASLVSPAPNWAVPLVGGSTGPGPPSGAGHWAPGGGDNGSSGTGHAGGGPSAALVEPMRQLSMEELKAANKALVESIRQGLGGNEEQFADFKRASAEFRRGELSSVAYYEQIARLGLSYVVPELARLCPDPTKTQELLAAHAAGGGKEAPQGSSKKVSGRGKASSTDPSRSSSAAAERSSERSRGGASSGAVNAGPGGPSGASGGSASRPPDATRAPGEGNSAAARKGKAVAATSSSTAGASLRVPGEEGGAGSGAYRKAAAKGKAKVESGDAALGAPLGLRDGTHPGLRGSVSSPNLTVEASAQRRSPSPATSVPQETSGAESDDDTWACSICTLQNDGDSRVCAACGSGRPGGGAAAVGGSEGKKKKKAPKFQRLRLGDAGSAHFFSTESSLEPPAVNPWGRGPNPLPPGAPRGAWRGAGGQRLVEIAQKDDTINAAWGRFP